MVVGGDLPSLAYAAIHKLPVIFVTPKLPFRFDFMDENLDLRSFGIPQNQPVTKVRLWQTLLRLCSLSGLVPVSTGAQSIRIRDDLLVISTDNMRVVKAEFNKLLVFDPDQIQTLPSILSQNRGTNRVLDWFNVRSGCRHDIDSIAFEDNFIKEMHFYPTDRSDNSSLKDVVAISYLNDDEVQGFDFSETMARHKVEYLMKEAGIKGRGNGYNNNKPVYLSIKVEHADREIVPSIKTIYERDDRFLFMEQNINDILKQPRTPSYIDKLISYQ